MGMENFGNEKDLNVIDDKTQITYGNELARKGIHLASLGIPIIYLQIPHALGIGLLFGLTILSLLIDVLMHYHMPTRKVMMTFVGGLLREHEKQQDAFRLTGASWVLIAATLTFWIFPTAIAVAAFTILIVSDTFAALVGRRYGTTKFLDKSLVGAVTFVVTGFGVILTYGTLYNLPSTFLWAGLIGSIVGGVMEAGSTTLKVDDNISVPASIGLVMWGVELIGSALGHPNFSGMIP